MNLDLRWKVLAGGEVAIRNQCRIRGYKASNGKMSRYPHKRRDKYTRDRVFTESAREEEENAKFNECFLPGRNNYLLEGENIQHLIFSDDSSSELLLGMKFFKQSINCPHQSGTFSFGLGAFHPPTELPLFEMHKLGPENHIVQLHSLNNAARCIEDSFEVVYELTSTL